MTRKRKYILRTLAFIGKLLLVVLTGSILIVMVFFSSSHMINVNLLIREGMKQRALVILEDEETDTLEKYFTKDCIAQDSELTKGTYQSFTIAAYNHKVNANLHWVWPWNDRVEIVIDDIMVNLRGSYLPSGEDGEEDAEEPSLPEWNNAKYKIVLQRQGSFFSFDSKWVITQLELVEALDVSPLPTPPASVTPMASAGASGSVIPSTSVQATI